jgi:hypothetical protein
MLLRSIGHERQKDDARDFSSSRRRPEHATLGDPRDLPLGRQVLLNISLQPPDD